MPTYHYSKKRFIEEMQNLIKDDEHVILTNDIEGTVEALKRKKTKRVPFSFSSDAFEREDSIGDLLKSEMFSVVIASDSIVAKKFKNADIKKG